MTRSDIVKLQGEINSLTTEGKKCKNNFRMQCIAQEIVRLQAKLSKMQNELMNEEV